MRRESFEPAEGFEGSLYVMTAGPDDAPPLLLIHGLGDQGARDFEPILAALSARFRVLAFDLPGLARSKRLQGSYAPSDYVRMIRALVERHFEGPIFVLGHSMGGALALQYAAEAKERVARLALLDVAGILHYREYLRELVAGKREGEGLWTRPLRGAGKILLSLGLVPASRLRIEDSEAGARVRDMLSAGGVVALLFLQHDFGPALRGVQAPTWLGWGVEDGIAPRRTAELLRAALRPREDVLFLQSGHTPMRTEPTRVSDSLIAFFERASFAPLPEAPALKSMREGRCERKRYVVFEGDYDRIEIVGCKGVTLRRVRTHSLHIERSTAELTDVSLFSKHEDNAGLLLRRSRIKWTFGHIDAAVCIDSERSGIDIAGVTCRYRRESMRVHGSQGLRAHVSEFTRDNLVTRLHGEYRLRQAGEGELSGLVLEEVELREETP